MERLERPTSLPTDFAEISIPFHHGIRVEEALLKHRQQEHRLRLCCGVFHS